jgi:molybdopterin converting factor small subunit
MATVHLPGGWTAATGGLTEVSIDAPRVRELLRRLVERFPAIAPQLETVSIAVDGEIHHDAEFLPIGEHSEIYLLPRVSGGSGQAGQAGTKRVGRVFRPVGM